MKTLFCYELRKMFGRPLTLLALAVVLGFSILTTVSALREMHSYDYAVREGSGLEAAAIDRSIAARYAGPLTDEKVRRILSEFPLQHDLHGMNAKYAAYNTIQSAAFARFVDENGNWNGLSVSDVFGDQEIQVGYVEGWLCTSRNLAQGMLLLTLAAVVMTAPVFSGEYGGADSLILTSRYGKTRGAAAKVLAAFWAAGTVTALECLAQLLPALVIYGREGLGASILFAPVSYVENYIPWNLSCGTVLAWQIFLAFTAAFAVTGITLLLSALNRNQLAAAAMAAGLLFLPLLLPVTETSAFYRLWILLPVYQVQHIALLSVGGRYALWALPVAAVLAVGGGVLSRRCFAGHSVT